MKVYTDIDLKKNELQYAVIHPLSSAPTGVLGQIYYNSTDKHLYQHDGTNWVRVGIAYDLEADSVADAVILKLIGDNNTVDTVRLVGDNGTTITQNGQEITISSSDTNTTYTFSGTASASNYVITITPSTGTAQTVTISLADATNAGLMSPTQYSKLAGIEDGAQVNPNNFSEVVVDSTPIGATSDDDTFTLESGTNIIITPDTVNKKATISASNTSYPEGTPAQIEGGDSTTPSVWSPQTLHDYVDQKTSEIDIGYSCEPITTPILTETVTVAPDGGVGWANFTYFGDIDVPQILVIYDGVTYILDQQTDYPDPYVHAYGAKDTNNDGYPDDFSEYPFAIWSSDGNNSLYTELTSGTHTVSVSEYDGVDVDTTECFDNAVCTAISEMGCGGGGGGSKSTYFGYSNTTLSTSVKEVTSDDFPYTGDGDIPNGTIIGVMFSYGNTSASPELAINNGYSISINVGSASANSGTNTLKWSDSAMLYFMFEGNVWELISVVTSGSYDPRGANTWYGTCSTNASTAAKVVTAPNYVLTKGSMVVVSFAASNSANSPTLNVNSTGAKSIYIHGSVVSQTNPLIFGSNSVLTFMYDGTGYKYISADQSAIGTQVTASLSTAKTLTANTWTNLLSVSLTAGTWLCICGLRCPSSDSGLRVANLELTSANSSQNASFTPSSAGMNSFTFTKCITLTETKTYYLNAMSTAGSSASTGGIDANGAGYGTFIQAVRLV